MEPAANYFLRYAFPCAEVKLEHGEITAEQHDKLKSSAISGRPSFSTHEIETIFNIAAPSLDKLREEMAKDSVWDMALQQRFWRFYHNKYLLRLQGYLQERGVSLIKCMVLPVEVIDFSKGLVRFRDKEFIVRTDMVKPCKYATKHYDYLVEAIDEKTYKKMLDSIPI
jgi:hypothetical protein